MDKFIVTFIGALGIAGIYWFFFGKKELPGETKSSWDITVKGGYQPATIRVPRGKKATLTFTRTDSNSCLEDMIMEDFKIKKFLPLNQPVPVSFTPDKAGTFGIHCGMNMFHGKIIVV